MQSTFNKLRKSKKLNLLIFGSLLIFIFYKNFERIYHLYYYSEQTIGKTIELGSTGNAKKISYEYTVQNKNYTNSKFLKGRCGECNLNKFFIVKYSSKKPGISELEIDKEIKDSILIKNAGF